MSTLEYQIDSMPANADALDGSERLRLSASVATAGVRVQNSAGESGCSLVHVMQTAEHWP